MFNAIVKGSIVGAIVAFVWGFLSWMVLPWHENAFKNFQNEEFVSWAIKENAPTKGIYIAPYCHDNKTTSETEREKVWDKYKENRLKGPVVFASVSPKGETRTMPMCLIINFVIELIGSGLIMALLMHSRCKTYRGKVSFVTGLGVLIAFFGLAPYWNWWSFPTNYILVEFADNVIAALLIGLAIAPFAKMPRPHMSA